METTKSKAAKIIKLAEFLVIAEQRKRRCVGKGQGNISNYNRTISVSSRLIYDIITGSSDEDKEEIFNHIAEYAGAVQNDMAAKEMWWLEEPIFTIKVPAPSVTLNACKIVRPLYNEMCQKFESQTSSPEM